MKTIVTILVLITLAFPAFAEEKDDDKLSFAGPLFGGMLQPVGLEEGSHDFHVGVFTFGVFQRDSDTTSSKFLEYRDIPNGGVVPFFRLQGLKGDLRYDLIGHDVTQKDHRYFGLLEGKSWKIDVDYVGVPHSFGNGARAFWSRCPPSTGPNGA